MVIHTIKGHLHHITVHLVVSNYVVGLVFAALFLITGKAGYDTASYYTLSAGLAVTPLGYVTGVRVWRNKYKGRWAKIFKVKVIGGLALFLLGLVSVYMRYLTDNVLYWRDAWTVLYIAFLAMAATCVMVLGFYGAKLTIK